MESGGKKGEKKKKKEPDPSGNSGLKGGLNLCYQVAGRKIGFLQDQKSVVRRKGGEEKFFLYTLKRVGLGRGGNGQEKGGKKDATPFCSAHSREREEALWNTLPICSAAGKGKRSLGGRGQRRGGKDQHPKMVFRELRGGKFSTFHAIPEKRARGGGKKKEGETLTSHIEKREWDETNLPRYYLFVRLQKTDD